MATARSVNQSEFQAVVRGTTRPVLVDFYATWCPPCRRLAPVLDSVAGRFAGRVDVIKVNIDENPQLASQFRIQSVPTLVMLVGGVEQDRVSGAPGEEWLVRFLNQYAAVTA